MTRDVSDEMLFSNIVVATVLWGALLIGCQRVSDSDSPFEECTIGAEACPCGVEKWCEEGLVCLSNRCVSPLGEPSIEDTDLDAGFFVDMQIDTEPGDGKDSTPDTQDGEVELDTESETDHEENAAIAHRPAECQYALSCYGDVCDSVSSCCSEASCGAEWFSDPMFMENYCYSHCDDKYGETRCLCDDICVAFDGEDVEWCLAPGKLQIENLRVKILMSGVEPPMTYTTAIASSDIIATLDGRDFPLSIAHGYIVEEGEAIVQLEGLRDQNSIWMVLVAIPLDKLVQGGPVFPYPDLLAEHYNFWAWIYSGYLTEGKQPPGNIERQWAESIFDFSDSTITIDSVGDPCSGVDGEDCSEYQFDLNLRFFAMRSEMKLAERSARPRDYAD